MLTVEGIGFLKLMVVSIEEEREKDKGGGDENEKNKLERRAFQENRISRMQRGRSEDPGLVLENETSRCWEHCVCLRVR